MTENIWVLCFLATLSFPSVNFLYCFPWALQIFVEIQVSILLAAGSYVDLLGNKSLLKQIETFKLSFPILGDGWTESCHCVRSRMCKHTGFLCPSRLCLSAPASVAWLVWYTLSILDQVSRRQTLKWRLVCGEFVRNTLGRYTCEGVRKAGPNRAGSDLQRGYSWVPAGLMGTPELWWALQKFPPLRQGDWTSHSLYHPVCAGGQSVGGTVQLLLGDIFMSL